MRTSGERVMRAGGRAQARGHTRRGTMWPCANSRLRTAARSRSNTMPSPDQPRKHFSMIRGFHLADFLTLGNAACGVAGVFCAMAYVAAPTLSFFLAAAALAPAAFAFDVLDGRVARSRQQHSPLGRE